MRTGKQRGGGGGRRSPRARTTAGEDAVTLHRGWGQGQAVDFSQRVPGPQRETHHSSLPSINVASGPPWTDPAGGDGNRTGQKEKEGGDYCWEEARGITRAYNGQKRTG